MNTESVADLLNLGGKVAIVTGAGSGIGRATATRLAEAGAQVLVSDIKGEAAAETAAAIRSAGGKAVARMTDVRRTDETAALVQQAVTELGGIDIVVNNAGIMPPALAVDITEEQWDRVVTTNLRGMFFLSQAAARHMIAMERGGAIVNIASMDALLPTGALTHYDAAKAGVVGMTKALAKEWGPRKIRVNAVAPGNIWTPGAIACGKVLLPILGLPADPFPPARSVLGRFGQPDDMAKVVLFLASSMSSFVTGSMVLADGGALLI